jgi:hypothetical protein
MGMSQTEGIFDQDGFKHIIDVSMGRTIKYMHTSG